MEKDWLDRALAVVTRPSHVRLEKLSANRVRQSAQLLCPPAPQVWRHSLLDVAFTGTFDATGANPLHTLGLELRAAFMAIGAGDDATGDNGFWRRKCRELLLRPAVEPLLLAHWNTLKSFDGTEAQMSQLSSLLCGSKQGARTRDGSYGLWDECNVRFEPAEQARTWWDDIRSVANEPELEQLLPAYAFARTIIAHPYPDGNGRLARALFHASLARTAEYPAPILPLAPAFYLNGAKVATAMRKLSDTGDWNQMNSVLGQVLTHAANLSRTAR